MGEQRSKHHISAGLLAHVSASRREPHFYSYIPGPKTGDFSCPAESKLFQGSKMPPYVVVSLKQKPQHMVVDFQVLAL
ncbi:MAG: hypothetical protein IJ001_00420 [Oscillospiraceae bacterium]|nr:hypothetical protein [Oscillospiraceae bacterium]